MSADKRPDDAGTDQDQPHQDGADQRDPTRTKHPTGEKQATENVENESAG